MKEIKSNTKLARLKAIRKNPKVKSYVSKLIANRGIGQGGYGGIPGSPPSENRAIRVSDNTIQNINDSANISQLLPETDLAKKILVSSILSPKDLMTIELSYKTVLKDLPSELTGQMLEVIKTHFEEVYNLKSKLTSMLEEPLFSKGSYPLLVLPEASIDKIINSTRFSLESLSTELNTDKTNVTPSIGILGPSVKRESAWSLESIMQDTATVSDADCFIKNIATEGLGDIKVVDNLDCLKIPSVIKRMRQERISGMYHKPMTVNKVGTEAKGKTEVTDNEVRNEFFKNRSYAQQQYLTIDNINEKENSDNPLVMKLPAESVIPVHTPSDPEDHVGYFILLDTYGNPINKATTTDYYRNLASNAASSGISSKLLDGGVRATEGSQRNTTGSTEMDIAETVRLYSEVVEKDLIKRLKNGVYGEDIEISRPMDVYRVMLARSLAQKGTQIIFVPRELLTYITFDYNNDGVGKSLLEDNKILASMRAMLLFSNTMAAIKNSTPRTSIKIELDPDDSDPSSTVEFLINEYKKVRSGGYPLHASSPTDIINFLQNAGIDVEVSGNSAYPETKLDIEEHSSNQVGIDTDLEEDLKRKYFMSLGLSPETIEMSGEVDFATSIVSSNLLLAKRVLLYQDKLMGFIGEFIKIYSHNSNPIINTLIDILDDNKKLLTSEQKRLPKESIARDFINSIEVHLPRPESAKIDNQSEAYDAYTDFIENGIDAYLSEDIFDIEGGEDVDETISTLRSAVLTHYQRKWLRDNNVLPELMDIVTTNGEDEPKLNLAETHGNHLDALGKSINGLMEKLLTDKVKRDKKRQKIEDKVDRMTNEPEPSEEEVPEENADTETPVDTEIPEETPEETPEGTDTTSTL